MVYARRVKRLLDIHPVIDDVDDDLKDGCSDAAAAACAHAEPERAIFSEHDSWCHRRERAFAALDCIALALNDAPCVWRPWLGGEVVHFIVEQNAGAFDRDA